MGKKIDAEIKNKKIERVTWNLHKDLIFNTGEIIEIESAMKADKKLEPNMCTHEDFKTALHKIELWTRRHNRKY